MILGMMKDMMNSKVYIKNAAIWNHDDEWTDSISVHGGIQCLKLRVECGQDGGHDERSPAHGHPSPQEEGPRLFSLVI